MEFTGERFLPDVHGNIELEHLHRYLFAASLVEDKEVLDIASGEGYGSAMLAERARQVVGVDVSEEAVSHANTQYDAPNLEFRVGSCSSVPLEDASVDVVVSFETIEHHDEHEAMMAEIKRVLRSDGILVISSPEKFEYSDKPAFVNPYHVKELYRFQFDELLRKNFRNCSIYGQRVLYGSAIICEDRPSSAQSYELARRTCAPIHGIPHPLYLVAIASDGRLPDASGGILEQSIDRAELVRGLWKDLSDREKRIAALDRIVSDRDEHIGDLDRIVSGRDGRIGCLNGILSDREKRIAALDRIVSVRDARIAALERLQLDVGASEARASRYLSERDAILDSTSWRITAPIRRLRRAASAVLHGLQRARNAGVVAVRVLRGASLSWLITRSIAVLRAEGLRGLHLRWALATGRGWVPGSRATARLDEAWGSAGAFAPGAPGGGAVDAYEQLVAGSDALGSEHVPLAQLPLAESRIRAIAFYLPQFYPTDENNLWWGKGFTEWTNVSKAIPQFVGHYQPRLPGELGFYDLRVPQVQERQVELARQYGLTAFCFYHYWFSGHKRLLDLPLRQYLANKKIDFPFCVCWANENWTRRWDGLDDDVLMKQSYAPEDDLDFITDIAPVLRDERYLRVDGKPMLLVYRVALLPDPLRSVEVWRSYCRQHDIGEIWLVAVQSFGIGDPGPFGFDAAVEFPPHGLRLQDVSSRVARANPEFRGKVYLYSDAVNYQINLPDRGYLVYPCVFPSWDNDARRPGQGYTFTQSTPDLYRKWLCAACERIDQRTSGDEKVLFINAWNEWAEGAYLEPDRRFGYAYLAATQQALAHYPAMVDDLHLAASNRLIQARRSFDTAIVLHLFYPEMWPEFARRLSALEGCYDLYVTYPEGMDESMLAPVRQDAPRALLLPFPNRGRDVAPFLTVVRTLDRLQYAQVCKLHTKKSTHRSDGDCWRRELLDELLGDSGARAASIISAFREDPKLGIVGPAGHWLDYRSFLGSNRPAEIVALAGRLGVPKAAISALHFFAGSMFWFRPRALRLMAERINPSEFDTELGQVDGTLAHELERLFAAAAEAAGFRVTSTGDLAAEPAPARRYSHAAASLP